MIERETLDLIRHRKTVAKLVEFGVLFSEFRHDYLESAFKAKRCLSFIARPPCLCGLQSPQPLDFLSLCLLRRFGFLSFT